MSVYQAYIKIQSNSQSYMYICQVSLKLNVSCQPPKQQTIYNATQRDKSVNVGYLIAKFWLYSLCVLYKN